MLWKVAEIVDEISSSEYAIDHRLSRFRWIPERGTLAVISGHIAHSAQDAMKVQTRTTILGVRGTSFLVQVKE